jgi:hypothetical protein
LLNSSQLIFTLESLFVDGLVCGRSEGVLAGGNKTGPYVKFDELLLLVATLPSGAG